MNNEEWKFRQRLWWLISKLQADKDFMTMFFSFTDEGWRENWKMELLIEEYITKVNNLATISARGDSKESVHEAFLGVKSLEFLIDNCVLTEAKHRPDVWAKIHEMFSCQNKEKVTFRKGNLFLIDDYRNRGDIN